MAARSAAFALLALLLAACGQDRAQQTAAPPKPATSLPTTTAPVEDCKPAGQLGDETLFLCVRPGEQGRFLYVAGETDRQIVVKAPGNVGHWAWARLSADGKTILAQWSAECEVPVAYFIPAAGGAPREAVPAYASRALRWSRDGRAVIEVVESACGPTAPRPGFYFVGPKGGFEGPLEKPGS
jgi:hypothetical protein